MKYKVGIRRESKFCRRVHLDMDTGKETYIDEPTMEVEYFSTCSRNDVLDVLRPYIALAAQQGGAPYSVFTAKLKSLARGKGVQFKCTCLAGGLASVAKPKLTKSACAKTSEELAERDREAIARKCRDWSWDIPVNFTIYIVREA